ncbi:MAG: hypothetical protein MJ189_02985, partial [Coriobacteriales bacterium]|nr:hypothetical protein [Coriobacteriales bacterium]
SPRHVGYINADGSLTDVTEQLMKDMNYTGSIKQSQIRFSPDGKYVYFYGEIPNEKNSGFYKLPIDDFKFSSLTKVNSYPDDVHFYGDMLYLIAPNGDIMHPSREASDSSMTKFGPFDFSTLWSFSHDGSKYVSADEMRSKSAEGITMCLCDSYKNVSDLYNRATETKLFINKDSRFRCMCPIYSTDDSKILFIGSEDGKTGVSLYFIPSEGGSPTKLNSDYSFLNYLDHDSIYDDTEYLIEWR